MNHIPPLRGPETKYFKLTAEGKNCMTEGSLGNYVRRSRGCLTQDVQDHAEKGFFVHSEVGIWLVGLYDLIYHLLVICSRLGLHHLLLRGHFPTKLEKG